MYTVEVWILDTIDRLLLVSGVWLVKKIERKDKKRKMNDENILGKFNILLILFRSFRYNFKSEKL